jgi:hypothetical protein
VQHIQAPTVFEQQFAYFDFIYAKSLRAFRASEEDFSCELFRRQVWQSWSLASGMA